MDELIPVSELDVGSKIRFGSYSNGNSNTQPYRLRWLKVDFDNTLITEYVEDYLAYNSKADPKCQTNSRDHGSGNYLDSAIDQYLNAAGYDWWKVSVYQKFGTPPDTENLEDFYERRISVPIENYHFGYADKCGFLTYFQEWEFNRIKPVTIKTQHMDDADAEIYEVSSDRLVYIPSLKNLGFTSKATYYSDLDEVWDFFKWHPLRTFSSRYMAEKVYVLDNKNYSEDAIEHVYSNYMTRSSHNAYINRVFCIDSDGSTILTKPYRVNVGIRPALCLKKDTMVYMDPDDDGYYQVYNPEHGI